MFSNNRSLQPQESSKEMITWELYHNETAYCWLPRPDAGGGGGFNCGIELEDSGGLIELEDSSGFIELEEC